MNTQKELVNIKDIPSLLLNKFQCGKDVIDDYFKHKAIDDDDVTTFGFINNDRVVALVSLCCTGIMIESGIRIQIIPAVEIKMFAVSEDYQHKSYPNVDNYKWSEYCLDKIIAFIYHFTENYCGASRIVLYSVPEAVNFYIRSGFKEFEKFMRPSEKRFLEGCIPMYMAL
ncbi:hypothetical protein [Anaeromassilibacillus sp. An172]|uniref:hypothetical protein n=1 Tax=Anaeromassilibacillus sp. An172 TaxID=1965570 RepID=UPI0011786239|nr:hypothetical protein [Anaeromassilibacillus sp. An172]